MDEDDVIIELTYAQYEAIPRLVSSMRSSDREATRSVRIAEHGDYIRVTFDAGWGVTEYDIDPEGNSAHVALGHSEISA